MTDFIKIILFRMIKAILIFNNQGKPRMTKFYQRYSETEQQSMIEVSPEPKRVSRNVYGFFHALLIMILGNIFIGIQTRRWRL